MHQKWVFNTWTRQYYQPTFGTNTPCPPSQYKYMTRCTPYVSLGVAIAYNKTFCWMFCDCYGKLLLIIHCVFFFLHVMVLVRDAMKCTEYWSTPSLCSISSFAAAAAADRLLQQEAAAAVLYLRKGSVE